MATMPGLPMFGHGQIEGFAEKYGMEYRRAYWDETPDQDLIARHEREIFPLLHRRYLFAEVEHFLLYDFFTETAAVNEDVFAYSNRRGDERALVVYHNRFGETRGWIRSSVGYAEKIGSDRHIRQRTLGEGLELPRDGSAIMRFRDQASGREYLRYANELWDRGLHVPLRAYECRVYLDWSVVRADSGRPWAALAAELGGGGTANLDEALLEIELRPIHQALRGIVNPELARKLARTAHAAAKSESAERVEEAKDVRGTRGEPELGAHSLLADLESRVSALLEEVGRFRESEGAAAAGFKMDPPAKGSLSVAAIHFRSRLEAALRLPPLEGQFAAPWPPEARSVLPSRTPDPANVAVWGTILAWAVIEALGHLVEPATPNAAAVRLLDVLRLRQALASSFKELGLPEEEAWRAVARIRASFEHPSWYEAVGMLDGRSHPPRLSWLADPEVRWLIGAHEHDGVKWFGREDYMRLIWWMALPDLLRLASSPSPDRAKLRALETRLSEMVREAEACGYRLDQVLAPLLRGGA